MKFLFQIMPALMNIVTGLFFFISAKRMAESHAGSYLVALTMVVWAVCYAATSFGMGRLLNKRNATSFLLLSETILLVSLSLLVLLPDVRLQYFWLPGTGIGGAIFFTSFQMIVKLFGKEEYRLESIARNTAIYTFSWSFGLATGPFIAALVWGVFSESDGWKYCYLITILLVIFLMGCTLFLRKFVKKRLSGSLEPEKTEEIPEIPPEQAKLPDLMKAAWILEFAGYFGGVAMMRTYLPDYCTQQLQMSTFWQGAVLALISYAQAFAALSCMKARRWPYKPWVTGIASAAAVCAMLIFALTSNPYAYLSGAFLLGAFTGVFCFVYTFHALVNLQKTPKYVAVNETIVGATSATAPLAGGFIAVHAGAQMPFLFCAALLFLCTIFFMAYTWRYRKLQ